MDDLGMPGSGKSEQTGRNSMVNSEVAGMATNNQLIVVSEPSTTDIPASVIFSSNGSDSLKQCPSVETSSDEEPRTKKARQNESHIGAEGQLLQATLVRDQPYLLLLPFDILLEILSRTNHPGDLLAVARTCKDLCGKLTDPSAYHLWRKMRRDISLPDPAKYTAEVKDAYHSDGTSVKITGVRNFAHEPAYAAFVFDGGVCEVDV